MLEVKYKENELVLKFTDKGWEVWKAIRLFKNLYNTRWELNMTDRDRGFIEEIYRDMSEAGVDFKVQHDAPSVKQIGVKDTLLTVSKQLEIITEQLKKLNPTLIIVYDKKIE